MIERLIILSDIHANLNALNAVINDFETRNLIPDAIAILGDNINYGMRPNEVISRLKELADKYKIIVNLFGNHEKALIDGDTSHFSTERGKQILDYTRNQISGESLSFIEELSKEGFAQLEIKGKKFLFIHGSIEDPYWGKLNSETVSDERYALFDYVISGHSHVPHLIETFYKTDCPEYRNKKRTVFINPGSVGQPRNHNPKAHYLFINIKYEHFIFITCDYDVKGETCFFTSAVDPFYSERLIKGI